MKKFSKTWKSSKNQSKQRKYKENSPLNIKHKLISSTLSPELRKKHNQRSISVRKGDTVKILRGNFKGKTGKVERVLLKKMKVHLENITKEGTEGKKNYIPLESSNLMITQLQEERRRLKK